MEQAPYPSYVGPALQQGPAIQQPVPRVQIPAGNYGFEMLQSVCGDNTLHLSPQMKHKIWNGEFINFYDLLKNSPSKQSTIQCINGELVLENKPSEKI